MPFPRVVLTSGVLIPNVFVTLTITRPANDKNVIPIVIIEVMYKRQEIVRIALGFILLSWSVLMLFGVSRSLIPKWTRHDVYHSVFIEITEVRALTEEIGRQFFCFPSNEISFRSGSCRKGHQNDDENGVKSYLHRNHSLH